LVVMDGKLLVSIIPIIKTIDKLINHTDLIFLKPE